MVLNDAFHLALNDTRDYASEERHDYIYNLGNDASTDVKLHHLGIQVKLALNNLDLRDDSCLVYPCHIVVVVNGGI